MGKNNLLYPALQKFYSSLNHLNNFKISNDFFENISSLDSFFQEFRNITFMLESSLSHTEYIEFYKKLIMDYAENWIWQKNTRNKITKQNPFSLQKTIDITIYSSSDKFLTIKNKYTVYNDISLSKLKNKIKPTLKKCHPIEVFFSAKFVFNEENNEVDFYNSIKTGIEKMLEFIYKIKNKTSCNYEINLTLLEKIEKMLPLISHDESLFIRDYVYFVKEDNYQYAERLSVISPSLKKMPLDHFKTKFIPISDFSIFEKFIMMHVMLKTTDLMPTWMIIYSDNTYSIESFQSSLKTTFYRKINELSEMILEKNIIKVLYMSTYVLSNYSVEEGLNLTSAERLNNPKKEILVFSSIDNDLNQKECCFEESFIKDSNYIKYIMSNGIRNKLNFTSTNMTPIKKSFEKLLKEKGE